MINVSAAMMRATFRAVSLAGCVVLMVDCSGETIRQHKSPGHRVPATSKNVAQALQSVAIAANDYRKTIPGFTCHESISSSGATGFMGFHHESLTTEGEIRVTRTDGVLKEGRVYLEKNGKRTSAKERESLHFPYFMGEAFGPPLSNYLISDQRKCLRFSLPEPGKLEFVAPPREPNDKTCPDIAPQAHGFVRFDPGTHTISHYERTVPKQIAANSVFAQFASVDFFPIGIDGRMYMLPGRILGTKEVRDAPNVFDARYTSCRLHKVTVTIHTEAAKPLTP